MAYKARWVGSNKDCFYEASLSNRWGNNTLAYVLNRLLRREANRLVIQMADIITFTFFSFNSRDTRRVMTLGGQLIR